MGKKVNNIGKTIIEIRGGKGVKLSYKTFRRKYMFRPEFPNPQFERKAWLNLNGEWDFSFNTEKSYPEFLEGAAFDKKINVPFCPESRLSGIGYTGFITQVAYKRSFNLDKNQISGRTFIHFGAVDWFCRVFVNGKEAGTHTGGYTSFKFDISEAVTEGKNTVVVYAEDHTAKGYAVTNNANVDADGEDDNGLQFQGKQSTKLESYGCFYTRTTGIWQTVWLEFTPKSYIDSFKVYPDVENCKATLLVKTVGEGELYAEAHFDGAAVGAASAKCCGGLVTLEIPLSQKHLWEVGNGRLYNLKLTYGNDEVYSYFGLRSVKIDGRRVLINGKSVFQRLVLDQGFYPDGIYTASSEEALVRDIELSLAAGFNGARLHEKVFEARFLYHCDRLGYIVWGEYPNWGINHGDPRLLSYALSEWSEAMERDFNHPAIVGWCPYNETETNQWRPLVERIYFFTKAYDTTRPCIDTSGWLHTTSDIYDVHNYEQDPKIFAKAYENLGAGEITDPWNDRKEYSSYKNEKFHHLPFFVSEYGGIQWCANGEGWGYGNAPKTEEEFIARYKGLTDALLDNEDMFAFCYTQLYDVEQEKNGLYTYEREPKFDIEIFRNINSRKAAIED